MALERVALIRRSCLRRRRLLGADLLHVELAHRGDAPARAPAAGRAPGWEKTSVPSLNAISVGIEVICAAAASDCSASVSTLPKTTSGCAARPSRRPVRTGGTGRTRTPRSRRGRSSFSGRSARSSRQSASMVDMWLSFSSVPSEQYPRGCFACHHTYPLGYLPSSATRGRSDDEQHPEIDIEQLDDGPARRARLSTCGSPASTPPATSPARVLIPMGQLPARMRRARPAPARSTSSAPSGNRCRAMADLLRRRRASTPVNVAGGTSAWARSGRPVEGGAPMSDPTLHRSSRSRPPPWVTAATSSTTARSRSWSTRSATSTGCWTCSTSTASGSPHVFETHIHNDYVTGGLALAQATGADVPRQRRRRGLLRAHPDQRRRSRSQVGEPDAGDRAGHARATPSPTCPTRSPTPTPTRRRRVRRVFSGGSLLYGATGRPDLLGAEHTHDAGPAPARLGPPARRRCSPTTPRSSRPTASGRSARPPSPRRPSSTIGQEKQANPVLTQDEETYVRRAARRPRRLARLLRPHGARRTPPGPRAPDLSARRQLADAAELRAPHRGRRVGRRPAQPHRLRRRARAGHAELRPRRRVRDLPRLADRLGHAAHPARRDRRGRRRGAARAGPDRHRPARRARHRRAAGLGRPATLRVASRPPRSPTSPRSATTARSTVLDVRRADEHAAARDRRRRQHPAARAAGAGSTRSRPARSGCTAPAATAPRSPPRCSTPPAARLVAVDDSFDNAADGRAAPRRRPDGRRDPVLVAVVAGALIGLSLGALGGGGSILAVPVLVYALGQTAGAGDHRLARRRRRHLAGRRAHRVPRRQRAARPRASPSALVAIGGAVAGARPRPACPSRCCWRRSRVLMLVVGGLMAVRQCAQPPRRPRRTDGAGPSRGSTTRSSPSARPSPASARGR